MTRRLLTIRELNRATLARQHLLVRASLSPLELIRQLVAIQGQEPDAPYIGLWTRLQAFPRSELMQLLEAKQVVKSLSIRGTLHLLVTEDYLRFHPVLQPVGSRHLHLVAAKTEGFDMQHMEGSMRAFLREQPRTRAQVQQKIGELYPRMGTAHMASSLSMHLALLHLPQSAAWGATGKRLLTEAETWLGRAPVASPEAREELVLRYLAAFGPASVKDMQVWSGLSKMQEIFERLRSRLCTFRDEQGRELFDLPDAPRPAADVPAPVRFLPCFDNLILAHEERCRVVADQYRWVAIQGMNTFLLDGFVKGTWKTQRSGSAARLLIEPFATLSTRDRHELEVEGGRLLRWIDEDAERYEIQFQTD